MLIGLAVIPAAILLAKILGHTHGIPNQHVEDPRLVQMLIADLPELVSFASAEPTFGGNTINPIGVILWLVHAIGILAMSAF